jgi:hypothetical protein
MAATPVKHQGIVQMRLMMLPNIHPNLPSISVLPAAQLPIVCGCVTIPTSALNDITTIENNPIPAGATKESICGSAIFSRIPSIPPTAFIINGSSKNEKIIVKIPWIKSVMMAAARPPATPYITKTTVITVIAAFAESKPCVLADMTSLEPRSIKPIFTERFNIPMTAYRTATLRL